MISQYYKPPSSKRINYLKFSYFSIIIVALSSFYLSASTTTSLADAQNVSNSTEIDTLFETANVLLNQKKYDEAIKYYDKILAINASEIDVLNHKGLALLGLHKNEEAIQYFDQVLSINASDIYALINKGGALLALQKNEEAIQYFDQVLSMNTSDVYAINNKA